MKSNQLIVFITVLVITVVIGLAFYLHQVERDETLSQFQEHQLLIARLTASKIENFLHDRSQNILFASKLEQLQFSDTTRIAQIVKSFLSENKNKYIESVTIYNDSGAVFYSTRVKTKKRINSSDSIYTWSINKESKGKVFIRSTIRARNEVPDKKSLFRFVLATPLYKNSGRKTNLGDGTKFSGIFTVTLDLKDLIINILNEININATGTNAWILDKSGTLIFSSEHQEMMLNSIDNPKAECFYCHNTFAYTNLILKNKQGTVEYQLKNYPNKLASFAPIDYENISWIVVVNTPFLKVTSFVDSILHIILVLLGVVISTFIVGSYVLLRNNLIKIKAREESKRLSERLELEKKAEEALHESETRYRSLVEYSPEAIVVHSEGKLVFINSAGLKLLGASAKEEVIGRPILDFVHPDYHNLVKERVKNMVESKRLEPLTEEKFLKLDGTVIDVAVAAIPFVYKNKSAIHVVGRDITENKRIENALRESEEQFRHLAEESPNIIFIICNGKIVYTNQKTEELIGYTKEELYSSDFNFLSIVSPEFTDLAKANLKKQLAGENFPADEYNLVTKNETIINTIIATKLINYKNEKAVLGIITDITELKQAEKQLRESKERYHTLFEQSPCGVQLINTSGNFVEFNTRSHCMLGYSKEEFTLLNISDINMAGIGKINSIMNRILIEGKIEFDGRYRKKDGRIIDVHITSQVIKLDGETLFHSIWEDITERRNAKNELQDNKLHLEELVVSRTSELDISNKLLKKEIEKEKKIEIKLKESLEKEKELSNLKSRFISTASHEFRTPLTLILSSADLLEIHRKEFLDEKYFKHIKKIQNSVVAMTELLDEVLTINRAESGKMKFDPHEIDLFSLCSEIIETHNSYDNHKVILEYREKLRKMYADPKIISSILNNLITNAMKYSPDGEVIILGVFATADQIRFEVIDHGIGIEKEDIAHLFEPFYRGKNVQNIKGSGLGLSIVQKSALLHGGSVRVQSQKGKGSVFTVLLKANVSIPLSGTNH
jgi:PAS domain S-box-containing protein